jgi:hypothetical protein
MVLRLCPVCAVNGDTSDAQVKKIDPQGIEYEIRGAPFEYGWKVQAFRGGRAVSPPYTVTHETAADLHTQGWGNAVEALFQLAQEDIENDRLPELKRPD